jgi:hypothetical protein
MGEIVDEKSKIQAVLSSLLDKKLSALETAFDKKLSALETAFDKKLSALETAFDKKLSALETAFDKKLSALESTLKSELDKKVSSLESELSGKIKIETKVRQDSDDSIMGLILDVFDKTEKNGKRLSALEQNSGFFEGKNKDHQKGK